MRKQKFIEENKTNQVSHSQTVELRWKWNTFDFHFSGGTLAWIIEKDKIITLYAAALPFDLLKFLKKNHVTLSWNVLNHTFIILLIPLLEKKAKNKKENKLYISGLLQALWHTQLYKHLGSVYCNSQ